MQMTTTSLDASLPKQQSSREEESTVPDAPSHFEYGCACRTHASACAQPLWPKPQSLSRSFSPHRRSSLRAVLGSAPYWTGLADHGTRRILRCSQQIARLDCYYVWYAARISSYLILAWHRVLILILDTFCSRRMCSLQLPALVPVPVPVPVPTPKSQLVCESFCFSLSILSMFRRMIPKSVPLYALISMSCFLCSI